MFLIAPLHCFYLLLFGFLLGTTNVLTISTAHTCTYTAARYCSITELASLLDEEVIIRIADGQRSESQDYQMQNTVFAENASYCICVKISITLAGCHRYLCDVDKTQRIHSVWARIGFASNCVDQEN